MTHPLVGEGQGEGEAIDFGSGIIVPINQDPQYADKIPELPIPIEDLAPTSKRHLRRIVKDLLRGKNVLTIGDRGTGKNTLLFTLAALLRQPTELMSFHEEISTRDLTQRMVLMP